MERYFIDGCADDADRRALLRGIAAIARDFGAVVVAEGVERQEDLGVIREIGIQLAQGFLLGRPSIHISPQKEQTCSEKRSFA